MHKQTKTRAVFRAGDKQALIWGECPEKDLKELATRSRIVADTASERVHAELLGDSLRTSLQCFDVKRARAAFLRDNAQIRRAMMDAFRRFAEVLRVTDLPRAVLEYRDCAKVAASVSAEMGQSPGDDAAANKGRESRNMTVWKQFLTEEFRQARFPSRLAPFAHVPFLIRCWFSILDGSCQNERDLGRMRGEMEEHSGTGDDNLAAICMLGQDGPKSREEIVLTDVAAIGATPLTDFSRGCTVLWRKQHGTRFGNYDASSRKTSEKLAALRQEKKLKSGTWAACRRNVLLSATRARHAARKPDNGGTAFGVERRVLAEVHPLAPKETSTFWGSRFKKFAKLTEDKLLFNSGNRRGRLQIDAYPTKERPAFGAKPKLPLISKVYFAPSCADDRAVGSTIISAFSGAANAQLVVLADLSYLFEVAADSDAHLADLIAIVGLGLPVARREDWMEADCSHWKLPSTMVLFHGRLATKFPVAFVKDVNFESTHPRSLASITACTNVPGSLWRLRGKKDKECGRPEKTIDLRSVGEIGKWVLESRRVLNAAGPKAFAASSS